MRSFRHRRGKILFEIFAALLLGSLAAARWAGNHSIFALIAATALTSYALFRMVMLFARNPALAYGDNGVQVGRLLKVSSFDWSDLRDVRESVWKRPYIPFMHWLPKERQYIELQTRKETVKVRPDMMELPVEGVKQIIQDLRAGQISVLGERGAAVARLGANPHQSQSISGVQAERLQRLGIGTSDAQPPEEAPHAPARSLNVPTAPVFGRKVS